MNIYKRVVMSDQLSTEERIKNAARKLILEKGAANTKTRDITQEAGINVALLNYYFRSKQNLFKLIMQENVNAFIDELHQIFASKETTLQDKLTHLAEFYIEFLIKSPELPLYILNELKTNKEAFVQHLAQKVDLRQSIFFDQLRASISPKTNPMHLIMNLISMVVFPFIAHPIFEQVGKVQHHDFLKLMNQRKKLIPIWMNQIIQMDKENNGQL